MPQFLHQVCCAAGKKLHQEDEGEKKKENDWYASEKYCIYKNKNNKIAREEK